MPGPILHVGDAVVKKKEEDCPCVVWTFLPVGGNCGSEGVRLSDGGNWSEAHGVVGLGVDTWFSQSGQSQAVLGGDFEADWQIRRRKSLEVRVTSFPRQKKEQGLKRRDELGLVGLREGWQPLGSECNRYCKEGYTSSSQTGKAIGRSMSILSTKDHIRWSLSLGVDTSVLARRCPLWMPPASL